MRAAGFADYEMRPSGVRPEYFPIVLNEPFTGRNIRVIGSDMFSESARRSAWVRRRGRGIVARVSFLG